jgi:hypothetical protein
MRDEYGNNGIPKESRRPMSDVPRDLPDSAVTMQLSPAALMVVGRSSLGHPYVGGNGMSPTRLGICASDRANAPRLYLPLRVPLDTSGLQAGA